jgi:hypothetical protein
MLNFFRNKKDDEDIDSDISELVSVSIDKPNEGNILVDKQDSNSSIDLESISKDYFKDLEDYYNSYNEEYELLKFIVGIGFINFKRKTIYDAHKKTITQYLNHKKIMDEYTQLKDFLILDENIISSLVENHKFDKIEDKEYLGDITNENIIIIKEKIEKLNSILELYDLYEVYRCYPSVTSDYRICSPLEIDLAYDKIDELKSKALPNWEELKPSYNHGENYVYDDSRSYNYICKHKNYHVLKNDDITLILIMIKDGIYVCLNSWGQFKNGLSFEDFLKVYKEEKE